MENCVLVFIFFFLYTFYFACGLFIIIIIIFSKVRFFAYKSVSKFRLCMDNKYVLSVSISVSIRFRWLYSIYWAIYYAGLKIQWLCSIIAQDGLIYRKNGNLYAYLPWKCFAAYFIFIFFTHITSIYINHFLYNKKISVRGENCFTPPTIQFECP